MPLVQHVCIDMTCALTGISQSSCRQRPWLEQCRTDTLKTVESYGHYWISVEGILEWVPGWILIATALKMFPQVVLRRDHGLSQPISATQCSKKADRPTPLA